MFIRNKLIAKPNLLKRLHSLGSCRCRTHVRTLIDTSFKTNNTPYSGFNDLNKTLLLQNKHLLRHYVKGIKIDDIYEKQISESEKDITKINELFTQPRATLNEYAAKLQNKAFDIHYKQTTVAPKGGKRKTLQNDWTCTYSFVWPEKIKFESTAISKRRAAEQAALQAIQWLYINKRIDKNGHPIYDKKVLNELQKSLNNNNIYITIGDNSIERMNKIWNDYDSDIKSIYESTFKEASQKLCNISTILKTDSTIDDQDFSNEELSQGGFDKNEDINDLKTTMHPVFGKPVQLIKSALTRREQTLRQTFQNYDENLTPLPIDKYTDKITSTLENSRVLVIVGAAGCGKSTRVPAAILRHSGVHTAAIVSEPRRVAAIGLAQRVADELGEQVGETIGYQVRLDSKPPRPPGGAILYCTSGVLLRRLQLNPGLEGCSHVFMDEAHERDVNTDVTLLLLKKALDKNPALKIIVMSATLDTAVFTKYFNDCPVIEVPGRTFPVEISHLEDIQKKFNLNLTATEENCKTDGKPYVNSQEVVEVIKAVDETQPEGAILVFLPGWAEIKQIELLLDNLYSNCPLYMVLPVHSRLSTDDQTKMFSKPLRGVRKIVLATNIAETSITIPDVVHVIDTGALKENRIKEGTGTASLQTVWVSQAGAKQRAGRAGRVQPGHCYRLYTKEKEAEFNPHTLPEILRIPLEQTVLDIKSYAQNESVEDFLFQLPEPPTKEAIEFAINDLIDLGALTTSQQLTRLGVILSSLTLHPRLGSCVLNAAFIGSVSAAAVVATHCANNVDLFRNSAERREEIREIKRQFSKTSDHSALHWIQGTYEEKTEQSYREMDSWCEKYGIIKDRLEYVRALTNLLLEQLFKTGIIHSSTEPTELNRFSGIDVLTSAILLSGCNKLLVTKKYVKTKGKLKTVINFCTSKGENAHIGSESVNYGITKRRNNLPTLLTHSGGHHSIERLALLTHSTSLVTPHSVLLFSKGHVVTNYENDDNNNNESTELYMPRHRLKIQMPTVQADVMLKAREMLWNTLQYYTERNLKTISFDEFSKTSHFKVRLVKAIGRILVEADEEIQKNVNNDYNSK